MLGLEALSIQLRDRDDYKARAEVAECGCPDDCERDHANE